MDDGAGAALPVARLVDQDARWSPYFQMIAIPPLDAAFLQIADFHAHRAVLTGTAQPGLGGDELAEAFELGDEDEIGSPIHFERFGVQISQAPKSKDSKLIDLLLMRQRAILSNIGARPHRGTSANRMRRILWPRLW